MRQQEPVLRDEDAKVPEKKHTGMNRAQRRKFLRDNSKLRKQILRDMSKEHK